MSLGSRQKGSAGGVRLVPGTWRSDHRRRHQVPSLQLRRALPTRGPFKTMRPGPCDRNSVPKTLCWTLLARDTLPSGCHPRILEESAAPVVVRIEVCCKPQTRKFSLAGVTKPRRRIRPLTYRTGSGRASSACVEIFVQGRGTARREAMFLVRSELIFKFGLSRR